MPPGEHSRLGGSKAKRWRNCPGSVQMEEGLRQESSIHASLGTAAHNLAETCLVKGLKPHELIGEMMEGKVNDQGEQVYHPVDEEMADAVAVYVSYCNDLLTTAANELDGEVWVEKRFDLKPLNPPEPMFGTADFVAWVPVADILHIVDYKNGRGVVVEAEENDQLLMYMAGAALEVGKKPRIIRGTIVQPNAYHPDGPIRTWELTPEELGARFRALMEDARRASDPAHDELEPGDWCRWCLAKPQCPAHMKLAEVTTQMAFEVLEPDEPKELPAPTRLSQDQLLTIMEVADQLEDWLKSVREHVHAEVEAGVEYPGWALADKRAYRRWGSEEELMEYLSRKRIPKKVYEHRKLASPAQLERALKDRDEDFPDHLVVKESSGTKLVRADSGAETVEPPIHRFFEPQS